MDFRILGLLDPLRTLVLLCFTFFLIGPISSKADFFDDLKSQPIEKQLSVLKHRIEFEGKAKGSHDSSQYAQKLLEISPKKQDAIQFLLRIIEKMSPPENQQKTLKIILDNITLPEFMDSRLHFEKIKSENLKKQVDDFLIPQIVDSNIDTILENKDFFAPFIVKQTTKYDAKLDHLLALLLDYGFLNEAEKVMGTQSLLMSKDPWLKFRKCELLGYKKLHGQAAECFSKIDLSWAAIYEVFYSSLAQKDQTPSYEKFQLAKAQFLREKRNYAFVLTLVYEMIIFKKLSPSDQKTLEEVLPKDEIYPNFLIYTLGKDQKILSSQLQQLALNNLKQHHPDSYLFRVATGSVKPNLLLVNLPKDNLTAIVASRL